MNNDGIVELNLSESESDRMRFLAGKYDDQHLWI